MTTIKDIASRAGVSQRTVRRALHDNGYVRREARENILRIAGELDYSPNRHARSLKLGQSLDVALCALTPECLHELHVAKLSAMEKELAAAGYALTVNFACEPGARNIVRLRDVLRRNPAAIAVLSSRTFGVTSGLDVLFDVRMPVLLVDCLFPGLETVCVDRARGVFDSVLFLAKKGRKRIAYLGPKTIDSSVRLKGYRRAVNELGMKFRHIECPFRSEQTFFAGMEAGVKFSKLSNPPDAVQVFSDEMALGFIAGLKESGVNVPGDVAVMGFDNRRMSRLARPALSTIAQPNEELGLAAAEILLARIRGDAGTGRPRMIPMKIMERETT